jgi:single-strand DNA-binding protein
VSATQITVIGNVVSSPERRRTQNSNVTNFRVAATERRFDSATQDWIDGHSFFVDIECWGELGGNVAHSISKGDPVVVVGAIRTDEWESEQGRRSRPRIRAEAVAPNLARGVADFRRTTRAAAPGEPTPPADEADREDQQSGEPVAGRDYLVGEETLHDVTTTDPALEPAHV